MNPHLEYGQAIPGRVNADFNDVRTIMQAKGRALMGIGVAEGDGRAIRAAEEAIVSPLLEQSTINGAKGVLVNVRGGCDMRMREVEEAVNTVKEAADPNANIIVGVVVDDVEHPELQVTVIAAGFPSPAAGEQAPGEASARPRPVEVAASAPKPAPKPEPVKPAPQLVIAEPEEQFLFPEERTMEREPQFSGVAEQDSDEDFSIPAFLRKRMKKRAK